VIRSALNSLLYFPSRVIHETPAAVGLAFRELTIETEDGERLRAWWLPVGSPSLGHVLLCQREEHRGRVLHAALLSAAGFDVLLFNQRGYGRSTGRPDEEGTYRDARAARGALLGQPDADASRVLYSFSPPSRACGTWRAGIPGSFPAALVPDAYSSLRRIRRLRAPLLVLHGERNETVPLSHGRAYTRPPPGRSGCTSSWAPATTTWCRSPGPTTPTSSRRWPGRPHVLGASSETR
jgi:uncharacterized protein